MSTNRSIDKICIFITILAVLVTALFMNGEKLGIAADDSVSSRYEDKLFDDSYVHTIDIEMSDWDSLLENATAEEYSAANVTIDGETVKNVGIRAKGNTSLSTVSQLGSDRYSLKIEFDAYQKGNTYYGLDKLCLNNLIQDYTMMKDYLAYKLMYQFGANAPLVSFCFITVNGEDWGLYLAVEAVEDSFLERNYGSNYGNLYKPDSMSMGGGRGNGRDFDMRDMDFDEMGIKNPFERDDDSSKEASEEASEEASQEGPGGVPDFASNGNSSDSRFDFGGGGPDFSGGFPGGGFGGFGMGSSDVKLQYSDDDVDSYSTIFNNAKTNIDTADKKRLISALKSLNEGISDSDTEKIGEGVNIEEVMRYMVIHNFLVNSDSYIGSMIHNYYLYEENGKLSMIPWDYNLAYGTFQSGDSDGAVNDPIDTPLSITEGSTDRPMFSWITACDEYKEMYHQYYQEFLDDFYSNGYLTDLVDTTYEMIKDYVDRDPTKFCTTEEYEKAVETIRIFVELRCESIKGQLEGTIGSTDSEQSANSAALIDASSINLSDMGSMGGGGGPSSGGGPGGGFPGGPSGDSESSDDNNSGNQNFGPPGSSDKQGASDSASESGSSSHRSRDGKHRSGSGGGPGGDFPGGGSFPGGDFHPGDSNGFPSGDFNPGDMSGFPGAATTSPTAWIYLGACVAVLLAAMLFSVKYRVRK